MTECKHEVLTKVGRWKQKRKCCSCGAVLTLLDLGLNPKALAAGRKVRTVIVIDVSNEQQTNRRSK